MRRNKRLSNTPLGRALTKKETYSILGIFLVISVVMLNMIYPLSWLMKSVNFALTPKVKLTAYPVPSSEPKFDFSDAATLTEKRLKDPNARIVFGQSTNGSQNNSKTWIANIDGSNPKSIDLLGDENTPLNNITYGWIFSVQKQSQLVATNYKTGIVRYISPPQAPGYKATIFSEYFSPDMNYVTFNVGYITNYCDKYGHQSGCETFMEVPGAKSGAYSYNLSSAKRIYLGNLDYSTTANKPRWDEFEDGMYAVLDGQWVKVDLETGMKIKVDKVPDNISDLHSLSPNRKMKLSFRELNHVKKMNGTITLVDLATNQSKDLIEINGDYSVNCSAWVSNTKILCELRDNVYVASSYHHFLMNVQTGEKKPILFGDTLKALEVAQ